MAPAQVLQHRTPGTPLSTLCCQSPPALEGSRTTPLCLLGFSLDSTGFCLFHWDKTPLNVEASERLKELRRQESDGWARTLLTPLLHLRGHPDPSPSGASARSPPPPSCPQFSALPISYSSQRSDSIFRTWDACSRRKACEILGRQLQAPPAPAGVLIRILQEDRLWINCPKVKIILALLKWLKGGKVILSREEKSFIFEPTLVLKCFETISDGIPNRIFCPLSPDLCQRLGSLSLCLFGLFLSLFFFFSQI